MIFKLFRKNIIIITLLVKLQKTKITIILKIIEVVLESKRLTKIKKMQIIMSKIIIITKNAPKTKMMKIQKKKKKIWSNKKHRLLNYLYFKEVDKAHKLFFKIW